MTEILEAVRTGAVAPAARDDAGGRFNTGDAIGFVDDQLIVWGDPESTLREVITQLVRRRRADHLPARNRCAA